MIPLAHSRHRIWLPALLALLLASCSSTRHVPQGQYLLDKAEITVEGDKTVKQAELVNYLKQLPNHRVLLGWKLQLGTYNLSGKDSTKWYNKWLRKLGQPPAIYDQSLTDASTRQLSLALGNRGYQDATVTADTTIHGRKIDVSYNIVTGEPHRVGSMSYDIPDSTMAEIILRDTVRVAIKAGEPLDIDRLEGMRGTFTELLRNKGYYTLRKDAFSFDVDTAENSLVSDVTMRLNPGKNDIYRQPAVINKVVFLGDRGDRFIKGNILREKCFLIPGELYSARNVTRTYEGLSQLGILKSINIDVVPTDSTVMRNGQDMRLLDAYIMLGRAKKMSVTYEIEGTNSEGDLGFGMGLTFQHRNLAHGSQVLTAKLRMSYESLSGNFNGLINDRYTEYAAEVGLTFPRFIFPFVSPGTRRRLRVNSELATSFNYQERPEYTRVIAGAAWRYKWVNREGTRRHTFDLIDASYVYLPKSTINFLDEIAPDNPLLRYSYEDHFIMRMGYAYYYTNRRLASTTVPGVRQLRVQPVIYTVRANLETAGNVLYALSWLTNSEKTNGAYKVFGIQYAQYVKGEGDYAITRNTVDGRQSFSFRAGAGIGVPYGNSTALPFEKRFYGGGANGVRGWSVRTLGPGSYDGRNSVTDFINQCGDIRLILTAEYRAKLFWVIESALFIDAGNIWTIKDYPNQPGGVFKFNDFYKQLAASYGVGLRLNFDYFLVRLDLGIKAHNPARGQEPWPLVHPRWKRDTAFHFAVGYPF